MRADEPSMNSAANQHTSPDPSEGAQPVPLGSYAYMRPKYLYQSAWIEHIPFAFWLIEALKPALFVELGTHWGTSYFAFCQALDKLDLGAQAFAIDRWTGDEHAGTYGAEVYQRVKEYNENNYGPFSTLLKQNFDEANSYFSNGSIDLLHIDGFHEYDAVKSDFEKWLPKMSSRGVVLLHDTNVRERNFGVFRLFQELRGEYPAFEFFHGYGLGVVSVGENVPEKLQWLFDAERHDRRRRDIHLLFASLGKACLDSHRNKELHSKITRVKQLEDAVEDREKALRDANQKNAALAADVQKLVGEAQDADIIKNQLDANLADISRREDEYQALVQILEIERSNAERKIRELETNIAELQQENTNRQEVVRNLEDELSRVRQRSNEVEQEADRLREEIRQKNETLKEIEKARSDTEWRRGELAAIADEREVTIRGLEEQLSVLNHDVSTLQQELHDYRTRYATATEAKEQAWAENKDLGHRLAEITSALEQRQHETEQNALELMDLRRQLKNAAQNQAQHEKIADSLRDHVNLLLEDAKRLQAAHLENRDQNQVHLKTIEELSAATSKYSAELTEAKAKITELEAERKKENREREELQKAKAESDTQAQKHFVEMSAVTQLLLEKENLVKLLPQFSIDVGRELGRTILETLKLSAFWNFLPKGQRLKRKISLLRGTGLFDPEWYRNYYVDIHQAGIDPIRHYIEHGAAEGRYPNGKLISVEDDILRNKARPLNSNLE